MYRDLREEFSQISVSDYESSDEMDDYPLLIHHWPDTFQPLVETIPVEIPEEIIPLELPKKCMKRTKPPSASAIALEPPQSKRPCTNEEENEQQACVVNASSTHKKYHSALKRAAQGDLAEEEIGEKFYNAFLKGQKIAEGSRKRIAPSKAVERILNKLFKNPLLETLGWIYQVVRGSFDISPEELAQKARSVWQTKSGLFSSDGDRLAMKSLLFLCKSVIFKAVLGDNLQTDINPNKQYKRTIFMIQRYGEKFLQVVMIKPETVDVLFNIGWSDRKAGTFSIQQEASTIPAILDGFGSYDGETGETIFKELFKGKHVVDFRVS